MKHPMAYTLDLKPLFQDVARRLHDRHFHALAAALRARVGAILARWREQSLVAMPGLGRYSVAEFEDSIAALLGTIAGALETDDPEQLRRIIQEAPLHGADRIAQQFPLDALLAEAGILRGSIVLELREEMGVGLREDEAAALHELIDLAVEHSALEYIALRTRNRESEVDLQIAGIRRLADLGTLVAGVAHDAANMLLPMRMGLDRLRQRCADDDEAQSCIETIELVFRHFENTIVNLRWLSVEPGHQRRDAPPLDVRAFADDYKKFLVSMLPRSVVLELDIPEQVPEVRITAAALSQILFNLIRNAQEAIIRHQQRGRIVLRAEPPGGGEVDWVTLAVEDDGPGMPPEIAAHCFEPFVTTKPGDGAKSGGLGLSVVHALVVDSGGSIEVHSPAQPSGRGTAFLLRLPAKAR